MKRKLYKVFMDL